MPARSFCTTSIIAFWFHSQADLPFPVLGTHWRGFSQGSSNILSPCGQCQPFQSCQSSVSHACFSALSLIILGLLSHSHKRQIWHKPPIKGLDQDGTKQFWLPVWWLGGMPIAPSTPGAQNVRFQSALSCGCNEDFGLHFKKLELISIWSVVLSGSIIIIMHCPAMWPNSQMVSFHPKVDCRQK